MTTNSPQREPLSQPSVAQSDGTTVDLRNQIVKLVSSTANGCLSELGYYPGMTKQLQQTLQAHAQLQTKNAKLYEDNRALAKIAANQNYRLAFLNSNDNVRLQQFVEMRDKVQLLSNERAELERRNEALLKGKAVDHGYQTLVSEMQSLREKHETLRMHHTHLRNDYTRLYNMATASGVLRPDGTLSGRTLNQTQGPSESESTKVAMNRNQLWARAKAAAVASSSSSTLPTNVAMQHRRQVSDILPQGTARSMLYAQQQQQQRVASEGVPQNQLVIGWRPSTSSAHSTVQPNRDIVPVPRAPFVSPSDSKAQSVSQQPTCVIPQPLTPLAIDARSLPITPISPDYSQKTPTQKSVQKKPPPHPTPASQWSDVIDLTADEITTLSNVSATISSDQEVLMRSPASSVEEPLALRRSSSVMPRPQQSQQEEQAPHDEPVVTMDSPASSVEVPLLKRSNSAVTDVGGSYGEPCKKPRLDDSAEKQDESAVMQMVGQSEAAEEDSEPGPDKTMEENGLMSIQDCISAVFEEDEEDEDKQTCNLCILRYQKGAVAEPPRPFVRPTSDVLIKHCIDHHPTVWEQLRNSPAQDLD